MVYDYSAAKAYCESLGLTWNENMATDADGLFSELELTQEQVTRLAQHHAWAVNWLFNPGNYGWRGRIALALHFLFGRTPAAFAKEGR